MLKLGLLRMLQGAGLCHTLLRLWRTGAHARLLRPALPAQPQPDAQDAPMAVDPGIQSLLFDLEQAWWERQQAWARLCREQHGPYRARAFAEWSRACIKTEQLGNAAAGDLSGQWRRAIGRARGL